MTENPYSASSYSSQPLSGEGVVHAEVVLTLQRTKPWMLFLAILGFIGCGLMIIGGIGMLVAGAVTGSRASSNMPFPGFFAVIGVLYLAFAVFYLLPCIRLAKTCSAITRLSTTSSNEDLIACLEQQRKFWKFIGVLTVIGIAVYLLFIVFAVVGSAVTASRLTP